MWSHGLFKVNHIGVRLISENQVEVQWFIKLSPSQHRKCDP